ncbi:MAG TPA: NUDIX hydrolase [Xanthobacteraceae bacterium]|nr:NUDIX hydrolase [Xanthobacteraceae bacterium]
MSDDYESAVPGGRLIDPREGDRGVADHVKLPYLRPKDSATLILIDRSEKVPKVLLGRRHSRHKFVPGKFVFPGGRVESGDRWMPVAEPLHPRDTDRLTRQVKNPNAARAAGFALAAIRETYEETGLMLGTQTGSPLTPPSVPWRAFAEAGILPNLGAIHFVARAITPTNRPRRFDSRFFAAEVSAVAQRVEGFVGPEAELVELVWLPITEASKLDMPRITTIVLEDLRDRIATGMSHDQPVPFYHVVHNRSVRDVL